MILERLFGANWRTTLTGIGSAITGLLTFLAAMPYEMGSAAEVFPPEWKARIAITGAIATFILRSIQSASTKDAKVSGIGTADDPTRKPSQDGTRSQILPILLILTLSIMGCASTELRDPATGKLIFRTQSDATNVSYRGNGCSFHADSLNHSNPTVAQGIAAAKVIQSTGTMAGGIGAAIATSGIPK